MNLPKEDKLLMGISWDDYGYRDEQDRNDAYAIVTKEGYRAQTYESGGLFWLKYRAYGKG